jgi:hypothetical protein
MRALLVVRRTTPILVEELGDEQNRYEQIRPRAQAFLLL